MWIWFDFYWVISLTIILIFHWKLSFIILYHVYYIKIITRF